MNNIEKIASEIDIDVYNNFCLIKSKEKKLYNQTQTKLANFILLKTN